MLPFALNHMTVPHLRHEDLFALAARLGCVGVELRNDLERPLFDGASPEMVAAQARAHHVRIIGLSQIYPFNVWSDEMGRKVAHLISLAKACGAETISLIPRNEGIGCGAQERISNLTTAVSEIAPLLKAAGLIALIEPLGFERSSLRSKAETIEVLERLGVTAHFKLIHDTFHHHLAGGGDYFPAYTGLVHISGVTDKSLVASAMEDEHRVLVDADDVLGNCEQIKTLRASGYTGPISFEAFSPLTHKRPDIEDALRHSIDFITARVG